MSIIGNIDGVPLFVTIQDALAWASANGMSGYHIHILNGQQGYMGGTTHQQTTSMNTNRNVPRTPRSTNVRSSGPSGGSSGY